MGFDGHRNKGNHGGNKGSHEAHNKYSVSGRGMTRGAVMGIYLLGAKENLQM